MHALTQSQGTLPGTYTHAHTHTLQPTRTRAGMWEQHAGRELGRRQRPTRGRGDGTHMLQGLTSEHPNFTEPAEYT